MDHLKVKKYFSVLDTFDKSGRIIIHNLSCTVTRNGILDMVYVSPSSIGSNWEIVNHRSEESCDLRVSSSLNGGIHLHLQKVESGQEVLGDVVIARVRF